MKAVRMADGRSGEGAVVGAPSYPKTRRISFDFGGGTASGRYFVDGDMVFSHFVAGLSGSFPPGEEGFIRSVRHFADQISDPMLKRRVAGFIGQESTHGQQHRRLNGKLVALGYPIGWWDSTPMEKGMRWLERRLGRYRHLALTAAAEHYTAVLAQRILSSDELQEIPGDAEIWNLLNWHALEELEHKSVALDVYRAMGGSERVRIEVMAAVSAVALPIAVTALAISLARDANARRQPLRLVREAHALFRGPIFKGAAAELAKYLRPGFHPDDIDTGQILEQWRRELFGVDGVLVDHLK